MIGRIRGILIEKQAPLLIVEAGGVGYEINAPMSTFYKLPDLGKEVVLHTHLVVREDSQSLYGFAQQKERSLFRELIKISGVGPKLALTILSGVDPENFAQCVADNDIGSLTRLPGVGKKTAERLLVEMRDRLKGMDFAIDELTTGGDNTRKDAISALIALGYKPQDANKAIAKHKNENLTSEELIRLALKDINT